MHKTLLLGSVTKMLKNLNRKNQQRLTKRQSPPMLVLVCGYVRGLQGEMADGSREGRRRPGQVSEVEAVRDELR